MRIAILGATSQIAKDLILSFAKHTAHDLALYSRRPEVVSQWLTQENLAERYASSDYSAFTNNEHFDAILNFVGVGDPAQAASMGAAILDVTLQYDELALGYVRKHPECRYIFLSSGAAYGSTFETPVDASTKAVIAINNFQSQDWYGVAKLHAECRHRSLAHLPIVDIRVFNYFSHTQNAEARFLIADIYRAIRDDTVLITSVDNIVRDYLHPSDFYQLVCKLLDSALTINVSVDCYSKNPIDKMSLLQNFEENFGLRYKVQKYESEISGTGKKKNYYSMNKLAEFYGYFPRLSSIEGLYEEFGKLGLGRICI